MHSPSICGKIASGETFTNRETEQKRLSNNIASCINSVLISPRRWEKSSLVARVGQAIEKRDMFVRFCFLYLFNVRSEQEFFVQLTREILRVSFSEWGEAIKSAKRLFKRITPKFSVGIDPVNDFSVTFDWEEVENPQTKF